VRRLRLAAWICFFGLVAVTFGIGFVTMIKWGGENPVEMLWLVGLGLFSSVIVTFFEGFIEYD